MKRWMHFAVLWALPTTIFHQKATMFMLLQLMGEQKCIVWSNVVCYIEHLFVFMSAAGLECQLMRKVANLKLQYFGQ